MRAVLINREITAKELASVEELAAKGATVFNRGKYEISEEEKRQINYETMNMVLAFGNKEFSGKAVAEWLKFEGSSLWYYHKFRAYFRLRNLRYEIAAIKKLAGKCDSLICYTSDPLLTKTDLPPNVKLFPPGVSAGKKRNYSNLFRYFMILKSRWLLNIFSTAKLNKDSHIIMDVSKRQTYLELNTMKESRGNYVIGYMIKKASSDFLIIDEAVQPKITDGARIMINRENLFGKGAWRSRYFGEPILLNYFLSWKRRKRKKELVREINNKLSKLFRTTSGDEQLLLRIFQSFRGATNYYLIKYLSYKRFFEKHNFKSISTVDENSPALRSILDAARISGLTTVGIQHGNIHDLHPAYLYTPEDIERGAVPDHSLIWGEFWKDFLSKKGNYPKSSLHICGQLRTDIIPKLLASGDSKERLPVKLDPYKKLIVFASQPQRDPELRKRAALDVMDAVKNIPGAFLYVKLHPNERYDVDYYRSLAAETGLKDIEISLEIDLYLLIAACDVVITCFSTVGTETVYFNKPLVILDHLVQDIQNYHKEGVAFQATNRKELETHLKELLEGKKTIDSEAYRKFIDKYAFAIDGKASERAMEVIKGIRLTAKG